MNTKMMIVLNKIEVALSPEKNPWSMIYSLKVNVLVPFL